MALKSFESLFKHFPLAYYLMDKELYNDTSSL